MSQQAVVLVSSYTADQIQEVNQRRVIAAFEANKLDYISVDGALQENTEMRGTLFGVSEQRGMCLIVVIIIVLKKNVICFGLQESTRKFLSKRKMGATVLLDCLKLLKVFSMCVHTSFVCLYSPSSNFLTFDLLTVR